MAVAIVGEIAGDVEVFGECDFDLMEEGGDVVEGGGREDARGVEEEVAVAVLRVEAGGFEEDGVGVGFDEGVEGGGKGYPVLGGWRHASAMITEVGG